MDFKSMCYGKELKEMREACKNDVWLACKSCGKKISEYTSESFDERCRSCWEEKEGDNNV